jgi:hypothetical protein
MAKAELIKARELIANGWTQHNLYRVVDDKPCYCLDGAVLAANESVFPLTYATLRNDSPETIADLKYLVNFIPEHLKLKVSKDVVQVAYTFNDSFGRTQEQVLAVLDAAIEAYPEI